MAFRKGGENMTFHRSLLGMLFIGSITLFACGADVADDDVLDEESAQTSQEHGGCNATEMKQAIAKCGSRANLRHCHSNGPKKKPSVACK
jgi:hypothetical protein